MLQHSNSASRLKSVMNKVGKAGSAVSALALNTPSSPTHNAGIEHGRVLNCYKAIHDYVAKMISAVPGMKALLLDSETTNIVGLVYSQSDMISKEVFLVESINVVANGMLEEQAEDYELRSKLKKGAIMTSENVGINEQNMQHLKAVTFIQPTLHSLQQLGVLLKSPRYKHYHIFFTNIVPSGYLEQLAELDVYDSIAEVHEFYGDFYSISPSLFHFNCDGDSAAQALKLSTNTYSNKQAWMYDRDIQGLLSVFLSLKKHPDIRYMAGSETCKRLATDLTHIMRDEGDLFTFHGEPTLLLIMDRNEDAVTPLLTQWTYQSMVHELLGIELNRVKLEKDKDKATRKDSVEEKRTEPPMPKTKEEKEADALRDVILSSEQDDFFRSSMFVNFGELGIRVKKLVADFQAVTKTQTKLESIEDMQRFVDNYPQFKRQSGTVSKHVSVMGEISKIVNARKLLAVSAVEQELVCGTEHDEVYSKLIKLLEDRGVQFLDKLRVVILYALRYESHPLSNLGQLRQLIKAHARIAGYDESISECIDKMLMYSNGHTRTWPLFADGDSLSLKNLAKSIQTNVKGIENIYTQHKSLMFDILSALFAGELKTMQFPFIEGGNVKTIYRRVIVFVAGGCTYEEYAGVESLLASHRIKGNFTTLVGGSCIHNSNSFLKDLLDLDQYRAQAAVETIPVTHARAPAPNAQPRRNPNYQGASSTPVQHPEEVRLTVDDAPAPAPSRPAPPRVSGGGAPRGQGIPSRPAPGGAQRAPAASSSRNAPRAANLGLGD